MYLAEVFPTKIRGSSSAIVILASKLIGSTAPYLETLSKNLGFHIINGLSLFTLVSIPFCVFLPETLGKSEQEKEAESVVLMGKEIKNRTSRTFSVIKSETEFQEPLFEGK